MHAFDYYLPSDVGDAAARAAKDSAFKAAGIDLLDRWKERIDRPATVIDLSRLKEAMVEYGVLPGSQGGPGFVTIGALRTLTDVATAPFLAGRAYEALRDAAGEAATPQVRNRATIGGNLLQKSRCWYLRNDAFACAHSGKGPTCLAIGGENRYHAILGYSDCVRVHPSNVAPALIVLDAQVLVAGKDDAARSIAVADLYPRDGAAAAPEHVLGVDEILMFVQFREREAGFRSAFRESREKLSYDWATTMAAVGLTFDGGKITDARIVLGSVAPTPFVAADAAKLLIGKTPSRETFAACAEAAFAAARPLSQNAYKVTVGKAVLVEALFAASEE